MSYNRTNYYMGTTAHFTSCAVPEGKPSYTSDSGSRYWYTDEGVIRRSNHWGSGIASCDWYLDGENVSSFDNEANGAERYGYCTWDAFEQNREYEVCVYGVDEADAEDYTCDGCAFASYKATAENMDHGYVRTPYGDCKFNAFYFMSINC